jgi:hypothetical protein
MAVLLLDPLLEDQAVDTHAFPVAKTSQLVVVPPPVVLDLRTRKTLLDSQAMLVM